MENTQILEDIGLTNAEIKVYLALLELGSCSAGAIIDKSGLQNSVVHMTLHKLIDKGFVSFVKRGKRNIYQASNPNHITEYLEEKKQRFQQLLPSLLLKQQMSQAKPEVTTFIGIGGVKELLYELLEAGGTEHHTMGSTKESTVMREDWWKSYHKKRAVKGIKAKLLFNASMKSENLERPNAELRYMKQGFEPLTETIIRNDKVGIIIWSEKPLGILIHKKEVADSYEQYFQLLWKQAK